MAFNFRKWFSKKGASAGEANALPDTIDVRIMDGVTLVTYLEQPTLEDTKRVIRYLANEGLYGRRVWDISKIDFPYSVDELRDIANYGRRKLGEANRLALVVKDTVGFGSTRAFVAYREADDVARARVFKSLDEAMQWAREDD